MRAGHPTSLLWLSLTLSTASCGGGGGSNGPTTPTTPTASAIAAVSGSGQTGSVESALSASLVAKVTSNRGTAMSGITVTFATAAGHGSVSPGSAATDASGNASTAWTLGTQEGTQTATASVTGLSGSPVTFTAWIRQSFSEPFQLMESRLRRRPGRSLEALFFFPPPVTEIISASPSSSQSTRARSGSTSATARA